MPTGDRSSLPSMKERSRTMASRSLESSEKKGKKRMKFDGEAGFCCLLPEALPIYRGSVHGIGKGQTERTSFDCRTGISGASMDPLMFKFTVCGRIRQQGLSSPARFARKQGDRTP